MKNSRHLKQAYEGTLSGATGRDEIRARYDENSRIHRISKKPLSALDLRQSPPVDQTFLDCTNKPASGASSDERIDGLEGYVRHLKEQFDTRCSELERANSELKDEIAILKLYSGLLSSRDSAAYNLLAKHLWEPLDNSVPQTITRMRGKFKEAERERFTSSLQEYRFEGDKRYKALAEKQGWPFIRVLDTLETEFLEKQKVKKGVVVEGLTAADIRPAMLLVVKKLWTKRVAGAHPYDADGLYHEDRVKVLDDIKASISNRAFESEELRDDNVLKLLSLACKLEELDLQEPETPHRALDGAC